MAEITYKFQTPIIQRLIGSKEVTVFDYDGNSEGFNSTIDSLISAMSDYNQNVWFEPQCDKIRNFFNENGVSFPGKVPIEKIQELEKILEKGEEFDSRYVLFVSKYSQYADKNFTSLNEFINFIIKEKIMVRYRNRTYAEAAHQVAISNTGIDFALPHLEDNLLSSKNSELSQENQSENVRAGKVIVESILMLSLLGFNFTNRDNTRVIEFINKIIHIAWAEEVLTNQSAYHIGSRDAEIFSNLSTSSTGKDNQQLTYFDKLLSGILNEGVMNKIRNIIITCEFIDSDVAHKIVAKIDKDIDTRIYQIPFFETLSKFGSSLKNENSNNLKKDETGKDGKNISPEDSLFFVKWCNMINYLEQLHFANSTPNLNLEGLSTEQQREVLEVYRTSISEGGPLYKHIMGLKLEKGEVESKKCEKIIKGTYFLSDSERQALSDITDLKELKRKMIEQLHQRLQLMEKEISSEDVMETTEQPSETIQLEENVSIVDDNFDFDAFAHYLKACREAGGTINTEEELQAHLTKFMDDTRRRKV